MGVEAEDRYPQLLRSPPPRPWQPVLGLALAATIGVATSVAVILAVLAVAAAVGEVADPTSPAALSPGSPLGLLANNLVLAMLVPASVLAVVVVHRRPVGWLASVTGRLRWRLLGRWLAVASGVVVVFYAAGFLVPAEAGAEETTPPDTPTVLALWAVILLTTPLQSAAEEVGFRGYLSQALASWFARPAAGALVAGAVSALLFALAHGSQDLWLFTDRLAFGAVASWLAWRTGGLEAPIALHVVNNLVALAAGAVTGGLGSALTASSVPWQFAVLDVTMMLGFALAVHRLAGRWQVAVRRAPRPAVLSAPPGVGYPGPGSSAPPPAGSEHPWGMG